MEGAEEEEEKEGISFSEGGQIWLKHFVTELVTLQQQKTQTSGQDLLRNRWCERLHKREKTIDSVSKTLNESLNI